MEINAIAVDPNMVRVILSTFCSAAYEGQSSLVPNYNGSKLPLTAHELAKAEFKVLDALNSIYPEIVAQYFDITKQMEYECK